VLALEDAPVDKIARQADTNRTSTYPVLERLEKMGLVSRSKKKGKTVYSAARPEKFLDILEDKKEKMQEVLPDLKNLFALQEGRPGVQLFAGVEGLKTVLNMILNEATTEVLIFSDGESFLKKIPGWADAYVLKRSRQNIRTCLVLKSSPYNLKAARLLREGKSEKAKTTKMRLLPESYNLDYSGFDIYNNKVVFYSFDKQNVAIVIESKVISRLMRVNFEILWNEAGRYDGILK
jgi:sugar-specific transcriptional regulator TrmB